MSCRCDSPCSLVVVVMSWCCSNLRGRCIVDHGIFEPIVEFFKCCVGGSCRVGVGHVDGVFLVRLLTQVDSAVIASFLLLFFLYACYLMSLVGDWKLRRALRHDARQLVARASAKEQQHGVVVIQVQGVEEPRFGASSAVMPSNTVRIDLMKLWRMFCAGFPPLCRFSRQSGS